MQPSAICHGSPRTSSLAMQLVSVITAPTDRSRPPTITVIAWAMATKARATDSLVLAMKTLVEKPRGWIRL
jgi:hypothetical protein